MTKSAFVGPLEIYGEIDGRPGEHESLEASLSCLVNCRGVAYPHGIPRLLSSRRPPESQASARERRWRDRSLVRWAHGGRPVPGWRRCGSRNELAGVQSLGHGQDARMAREVAR